VLLLFVYELFVQVKQFSLELCVDLLLQTHLVLHLVGQVTDALHPLLENGIFFPKFERIAYRHVLAAQLELEQNFSDVLSLRLLAQIFLRDICHEFLLTLTSVVTICPGKLLRLFIYSPETLLLPEPDNSSECKAEHFLASWGNSLVLLPLKLNVFFLFTAYHNSFVMVRLCRVPSVDQSTLARFLCLLSEEELLSIIDVFIAVLRISVVIYHCLFSVVLSNVSPLFLQANLTDMTDN